MVHQQTSIGPSDDDGPLVNQLHGTGLYRYEYYNNYYYTSLKDTGWPSGTIGQ